MPPCCTARKEKNSSRDEMSRHRCHPPASQGKPGAPIVCCIAVVKAVGRRSRRALRRTRRRAWPARLPGRSSGTGRPKADRSGRSPTAYCRFNRRNQTTRCPGPTPDRSCATGIRVDCVSRDSSCRASNVAYRGFRSSVVSRPEFVFCGTVASSGVSGNRSSNR